MKFLTVNHGGDTAYNEQQRNQGYYSVTIRSSADLLCIKGAL
jgi:hypothetical protein